MTASSDTDIKELRELILNLDRKIETGFVEVKGEIKALEEKVNGLDARLKQVEGSVQKIPDLAEKVGELKKRCDPASAQDARERAPRHWRQIDIIFITGTVGTILGWFAKSGRF